jgi:hypothetical protein
MTFLNQIQIIILDFLANFENNPKYDMILAENDIDYLLYCFILIRRKRVQPKYYEVFESKEFLSSSLLTEVKEEYAVLKKNLETKSDLSIYYNSFRDIQKIDYLLEDWNINHFHLKEKDFQLYFMIYGYQVYIINLQKHFAKNSFEYANTEFIEIIKNNWNDKICKINGVNDLEFEIDKQSRINLRNLGYNSPVKIKKEIYSMGFGISSCKSSIWATRMADKLYDWIIEIEKNLKDDVLLSEISKKLNVDKTKLNFELLLKENEAFCIKETNSGKIILNRNQKLSCFEL